MYHPNDPRRNMVHFPEDLVQQMVAEAIRNEREACACLTETFLDGKTDNISCIQANALDKVAFAIRNRSKE